MNKQFFSFFLIFFSIIQGFAQQASVKGVVKDMLTSKPVDQVLVQLEGTALSTLTNDEGEFIFSLDIPTGEQVLLLSKNSYFNLSRDDSHMDTFSVKSATYELKYQYFQFFA